MMARLADERIVQSRRIFLSSIKLGSVEVKNVEAFVIPGVNEGLLGMSFFKKFKFQIDLENSELILNNAPS
jgi:predicted aspartyl protease